MKRPKQCCSPGEYKCQVPMPISGKRQEIDICIADLVAALNAANITTVASCCGHGKGDGSICLSDGRELVIRAFNPANHVAPGIDSDQEWHKVLKAARARLGLTLRDVEERTGVSNSLLSQIETGKNKNPSVFTIASIIRLYGIGFWDVFRSTH